MSFQMLTKEQIEAINAAAMKDAEKPPEVQELKKLPDNSEMIEEIEKRRKTIDFSQYKEGAPTVVYTTDNQSNSRISSGSEKYSSGSPVSGYQNRGYYGYSQTQQSKEEALKAEADKFAKDVVNSAKKEHEVRAKSEDNILKRAQFYENKAKVPKKKKRKANIMRGVLQLVASSASSVLSEIHKSRKGGFN